MPFNFISNIEQCANLIRDWVPVHLIYYSHFPAAIIAVLLGIFVIYKSRTLTAKILFALTVTFSAWSLVDIVLWTSTDARAYMFFWSSAYILEIMLFFLGFYFFYTFVTKTDLSLKAKAFALVLFSPVLLMAGSKLSLPYFDIPTCIPIEGLFWQNYIFPLEVLLFVSIIFFIFYKYRTARSTVGNEPMILGVGIVLFLVLFSGAGFLVDLTGGNYLYEIIGLVGMIFFLGVLAYIIVQYKTFNIKLLAAQALVFSLVALIGSQFFFIQNSTNKILNGIALTLSLGFGFLLVRSVKREVQFREELQLANTRQQETMRFITHEVKGYLTDGAAALDALRTGAFGPMTPDMSTMTSEALVKNRAAVREIQNFLRIADFKTGKVAYAMKQFDFKKLLNDALVTPTENAKAKGLTFNLDIAPADYTMVGDGDQVLNHVIVNLVNNAINYTPTGDVTVHLEHNANMLRFSVKDSGIGLTEDDKKVLFTEGGHGKESRLVNPHSTGYGLFIAKQIVDAHQGKIWAESAGRGTGSTFFVELPTNLRPTLSSLVQK